MPASTTGRPAAVLSILVTANTRTAQAELAALNRQMAYTARGAGRAANLLQRSAAAAKFAGVGMAAGLAGSVAAAANFESAFAGVRKTVEATRPQFKRLEGDLRSLSLHIPDSAVELSNLAAEAGALGVKAKDLSKFTKTAAQLGTTTMLTSEAAADGLARIANIMDLKVATSVRRMGNVLVELGNKGASTEQEILEMSKRIAGSGKIVGMTEYEVMGLSAGLANLGIRAEMGGSAASRVLRTLHVAAREGGKELNLLAETAGVSSAEYAKAIDDDMVGALGLFLDGLAKIEKEGGSAQLVLRDLGKQLGTNFGEIRISDTLMRAMSSGKGAASELARAMKLANRETKENSALGEEAQERYKTLESQAELLKNAVVNLGIGIGQDLLPELKEMVGILADPKLEVGEKIEKSIDVMLELFNDAAPEMADIGAKLAVGLVTGMGKAFVSSDGLGQLFVGASIVRMIGGPGALGRAGKAMAAPMAAGWAASFQTRIQTEMAQSARFAAAQSHAAAGMSQAAAEKRWGKWAGGKAYAAANPAMMKQTGTAAARGLAFATANAIPIAIGVAGIVNILDDALHGDFAGAAWEAGGAAAGGIAGAMAAGLPGALVGVGLGSIIGSFLEDAGKEVKFNEKDLFGRIEEGADAATKSVRQLAHDYKQSKKKIDKARDEEKDAAGRLKEAEEELARVRRKYPKNAHKIARAEHKVAERKQESAEASRELRQAERVPEQEREFRAEKLRRSLAEQEADLAVKKRLERQEWRQFRAMDQTNSTFEERDKQYATWKEKSDEAADAQQKVNRTLARASQLIGPKFAKDLERMGGKLGRAAIKAHRAEQDVDRLNTGIKNTGLVAAAAAGRGGAGQAGAGGGMDVLNDELDRAKEKALDTKTKLDRLSTQGLEPLRNKTRATAETTKESTDKQATDWDELDEDVRGSITSMRAEISKILSDLGVSDANFTIEASDSEQRPNKGQKKQQGGRTVPGTGVGDKVLTNVWTEPGEDVFVLNSRAAAKRRELEDWNRDYRRHGLPKRQGGGLVQALGPYDIPPIAYDPNHAGGNSHLHLAMSSVSAAQALARRIAPLGWSASEAPWAGGVAPIHQDPGHYSGSSFDANAADESRAAVAAVARILGGAGAGGFGSAAVQLTKRIMRGPKGGMTNIGQGAIDKVLKAGNKYIASKQPAVGGGYSGYSGGAMSPSQIAKLWRNRNPFGSPTQMAQIAMAESGGDPGAVGHDPGGTRGLGLWQITTGFNDDLIRKYGGEGAMLTPKPNADAAGEILQRQGLGAWVVHNTGAAYRGGTGFQRGGMLPSLDRGGRVERMGLAQVHPGDVHRGKEPKVEIHIHGPGMDKLIEHMEVLVDGKQASVSRHNGRMARQRRMAT